MGVRPAGPLPARVYWVRRAVVLGIPLLLVLLVVWLVAGRGSGGAAAAGADEPTTKATTQQEPAPSPSASATGIPDCAPEQLGLAITADAESFPAGVNPSFQVTVTNTGTEPCLVDAGEAQRAIVVTSGDDRVWSNQDCVAAGTETRTLLLAGGDADTQQLAWNRVRSAEGCPANLPAPGAGTYSAAFTLAGAAAQPAVFGLG